MGYKQPVSVLVVIYTEKLDVLLLERADFSEHWQSVTGSRENAETLKETAVREVFEETGLDASQFAMFNWQLHNVYDIYPQWQHRYAPGTTQNTEHVFGLQLPNQVDVQLTPREHLSFQWLPWKIAAAKVFSPSNREAILQLEMRCVLTRIVHQ